MMYHHLPVQDTHCPNLSQYSLKFRAAEEMPSASLVSQPQGARQLKVGTGLTLIEIEKLGVGVQLVHTGAVREGNEMTQ